MTSSESAHLAEAAEALAAPAALAGFLARFDAVCRALGEPRGPLSARLFGKNDRVDQIAAGADIGVRRLAQAEAALAARVRALGHDPAELFARSAPPRDSERARARRAAP